MYGESPTQRPDALPQRRQCFGDIQTAEFLAVTIHVYQYRRAFSLSKWRPTVSDTV